MCAWEDWMGHVPMTLSVSKWASVCQLDCLTWQHGCFVVSPFYTPQPLWCPSSPQPFPPSALQDIYELKDQIQDVEGRYMQGLKELKVEGLELTACLLLSSGSSMTSLTHTASPLTPLEVCPVAPNTTAVSLPATSQNCAMTLIPAWSSPSSCFDLKWRHSLS